MVESQSQAAYVALRHMLVHLEVRPGQPLDEDLLGQQIGVGRTPLREAVKRLEAEGLIQIFPRRGTFAADVNLADLSSLSDVREVLEARVSQRAAERATAADRAALAQLAAQLRGGLVAFDDLMSLDYAIHLAIYEAAHNHFLAATLTQYLTHATRIWYLFADRMGDVGGHIDEHAEMLDAIINRHGDLAAQLAAAHVRRFEDSVRAVL